MVLHRRVGVGIGGVGRSGGPVVARERLAGQSDGAQRVGNVLGDIVGRNLQGCVMRMGEMCEPQ